jgi:hypothetical protein
MDHPHSFFKWAGDDGIRKSEQQNPARMTLLSISPQIYLKFYIFAFHPYFNVMISIRGYD